MEVRELLSKYEFPGDDIPIIRGSALKALEDKNPEIGEQAILKLMAAVDAYIPQPERPKDKPFLMPIEDVFSISGRGTVVTGRVERGIVKVGDEVEIVGLKPTTKTTVHRRRDVPQAAGPGRGGRQHRRAAARHEARGRGARPGSVQAGLDHAAHEVQGRGVHPDEGRGRPSHAVLHELPSAVLLPHDGRDGRGELPEGTEMVMPGDNVCDGGRADRADRDGRGLRFAIREGGRTVGAGVVAKIVE
jgi:elongation factor Tu